MNLLIIIGTALLLSASIFGYTGFGSKEPVVTQADTKVHHVLTGTSDVSQGVSYQNTQYGFRFTLPDSWRGYTIVTERWVGNAIGDPSGTGSSESGPLLSLRHPKWTAQNPRQDIPIMILTLTQWSALQQEKFHIGAAPIGPRELGRNQTYIFALPARYNFAFTTGFEEVEAILNNHPLTLLNK